MYISNRVFTQYSFSRGAHTFYRSVTFIFTPAVHSGGLFHFYLCCTFFQVDYFFYMFYTLQVCHSIFTCCTPDRWVVLFLPAIHLGKVGRGLHVPSRHTYSAGGGYSNLNPVGQEIEHCIVVGVLWHVAVPLTGLAGVRHLPSAEEVAERKKTYISTELYYISCIFQLFKFLLYVDSFTTTG